MRKFKKRSYKKKWFKKRNGTAKMYSIAKKVLKKNREMKADYVAQPWVGTPSSGQIIALTTIAEGTGRTERNGDKVKIKRIYGRFSLHHPGVGYVPHHVRIIVVRTKYCNPTIALGDILIATGDNVSNVAPYEFDGTVGFTVLYDKAFNLDPYNSVKHGTLSIKVNKDCEYKGAAATDYKNGSIFAFLTSNVSTNSTACSYYIKTSFTDM